MERKDTTAPAYNLALEESVIGALLLWCDEVYNDVTDVIHHPGIFYSRKNRRIYEAILYTKEEGIPVDSITVGETVKQQCGFDAIGGEWTLQRITESVRGAVNIITQCRMLVEYYIRRISREKLYALYQQCADPSVDAFDILDEVKKLSKDLDSQVAKPLDIQIYSMAEAFEEYKEIVTADSSRRVYWGLPTLDRPLRGTWPGEVGYCLAKQKTGKTLLVQQVAEQHSIKHGVPCLIFSLEMKRAELWERAAQRETGFSGEKIERFVKSGAYNFNDVADKRKNVFIVDRSYLSVTDMQRIIEYAQEKMFRCKLGMVVIDYIGLMNHRDGGTLYERVTNSANRLKTEIAANMDVPAIVIAQVNRDSELFSEPKPDSARDSGVIEQSCHNMLVLWNVEDPHKKGERERYPNGCYHMKAKIQWARRGGMGSSVDLSFNPENLHIMELE